MLQLIIFVIAMPLMGAGIGWLTNRMAIQMLFRPREPIRFAGLRLQGLIPRRQNDLADTVGRIVEEELFNQHLIREEILQIDLEPHLEDLACKMVQDRLAPKLRQIPLLGSFVNERILATLQTMAKEAMQQETPPLLEKLSLEVESRIAVRQRVEEKMRAFDLDHLETLIRELAHKEFKHIEWLGAIIGFMVGMLQTLFVVTAQLI